MHLLIFYHWSTRPWTAWIFILRLSVRPFSRLIGEVDYPPIMFTPAFWRGIRVASRDFSFTKCIVQHLGYFFSAVSSLESLLRAHLFSVLSMVKYIRLFRRGFQNGPVKLRSFPRELACLTYQSSWRSPILYLGCCFSNRFSLVVLADFFVSSFPVSKGIQNYWRDCSASASNILGGLLPNFLFHISMMKKVSIGSLPW